MSPEKLVKSCRKVIDSSLANYQERYLDLRLKSRLDIVESALVQLIVLLFDVDDLPCISKRSLQIYRPLDLDERTLIALLKDGKEPNQTIGSSYNKPKVVTFLNQVRTEFLRGSLQAIGDKIVQLSDKRSGVKVSDILLISKLTLKKFSDGSDIEKRYLQYSVGREKHSIKLGEVLHTVIDHI